MERVKQHYCRGLFALVVGLVLVAVACAAIALGALVAAKLAASAVGWLAVACLALIYWVLHVLMCRSPVAPGVRCNCTDKLQS